MPDQDLVKELARANRAFYRAFEELDWPAMEAVWADDDGVRCVHPGAQMLVGREAVLESWKAIFAGTPSVRFDLADVDLRVCGDLGIATCEEHIRSGVDQRQPEFRAVCTNLWTRSEGRWRMLLHHASPLARRLGP